MGDVARLTGVTVRTLHHYDQIGLVVPGVRTDAGYRVYGMAELQRLQEVLFLRELGFGLAEIRVLVEGPGHDRHAALRRQRRMLEAKAGHLLAMVDTIDAVLDNEREGTPMSGQDMLGVFGDFDPAAHAAETKERWGDSEAYRQSQQRTARYTPADWRRQQSEWAEIDAGFVALMEAGVPADSPQAAEVARRHRAHITEWFYDCTPEIHRGLAEMYVADPRFTENIDRTRPGLAAYMAEAITAAAG